MNQFSPPEGRLARWRGCLRFGGLAAVMGRRRQMAAFPITGTADVAWQGMGSALSTLD
ncbi:MAG: hypothetical protein ACYSWU_10565 [Planctomycetota bacterium]